MKCELIEIAAKLGLSLSLSLSFSHTHRASNKKFPRIDWKINLSALSLSIANFTLIASRGDAPRASKQMIIFYCDAPNKSNANLSANNAEALLSSLSFD